MNNANQHHDETTVGDDQAADTSRTGAGPSPVPPSGSAGKSRDGTAGKPELTWDLSDWFRIS